LEKRVKNEEKNNKFTLHMKLTFDLDIDETVNPISNPMLHLPLIYGKLFL